MEKSRTVLLIVFEFLLCCPVLRNAAKTSSTLSYLEFMKQMKKKSNQFDYNPNYGYEAYWADGERVLTTQTLEPGMVTTETPLVCGEECHYLYRRIKHVCARLSDYTNANGCWSGIHCTGKPGDNLNPGFETFDTYCKFLDAQCKSKFFHRSRYVLVYVGKCRGVDEIFKPLWDSWQPVSRMEHYLSSYHGNTNRVTRRTARPVMSWRK